MTALVAPLPWQLGWPIRRAERREGGVDEVELLAPELQAVEAPKGFQLQNMAELFDTELSSIAHSYNWLHRYHQSTLGEPSP